MVGGSVEQIFRLSVLSEKREVMLEGGCRLVSGRRQLEGRINNDFRRERRQRPQSRKEVGNCRTQRIDLNGGTGGGLVRESEMRERRRLNKKR